MQTPPWAIVTGICLMLFGGCSLTKSVQKITMTTLLESQEELFGNFENISISVDNSTLDSLATISISSDSTSTTDNTTDSTSSEPIQEFKINIDSNLVSDFTVNMNQALFGSEYTKKWILRFGYIGIFVALIYFLGGLFLLIKRSFSIKLAYLALILSIVFSLTQRIVFLFDDSGGLVSELFGVGFIFSLLIDIVLLIVLSSGDKSAYPGYQPQELVE